MSKRRKTRTRSPAPNRLALLWRLLTFATFFGVIFMLACLVTHHPADPPTGSGETVRNVCGVIGAYVSHAALSTLGAGSYVLLAFGFLLAAVYVARGAIPARFAGIAGAATVLVLLGMALLSFDAGADPHRIYAPEVGVSNATGALGTAAAHYLLTYIGIGIYVAVAAAAVSIACVVARHPIPDKVLRTIGVVLLVVFVSTTARIVVKRGALPSDPTSVLPEGLGGVLGLFVDETFFHHLGHLGAAMLLALVAAVGLLLSTDTLVLLLPLTVYRWLASRRTTKQAGESLKSASGRLLDRLASARDSLAATVAGSRAELSAVVSGDAAEQTVVDEAEGWPEEADDDEPEDVEEDVPPPATDQAPKRAPKIRTLRDRQAAEPQESGAPDGTQMQMRFIDASEGPDENAPKYPFPSVDLLEEPETLDLADEEVHIRQSAVNLEATLKQFNVDAEVVGIDTGPVITQYEVSLGAGVKVGKVISLSDDLAIGLKAQSVRIIAPLPGRGTIGIEVPNRKSKVVRIREAIEDGLPAARRMNLPLFLGKDSAGNPMVRDLAAMPHLLIGGTTGSGKSVCLNTIITSVLYTRSPRDVKFILVDPKMVEMAMFARIPHLMCPVVSDMSKVYSILEWLIGKMQERYALLAEAGVKNIVGYNALSREQIVERFKPTSEEDELRLTYHMPYIVLIVDELADLMMSAPKEVEAAITRLAQKSRAVGIHLVLATQRPSVDVVTGLIKSNHPCRIAFQVASRVDSRTILDSMGAEKLLGRGDMLVMQPGAAKLLRGQGAFISENEINQVVNSVTVDAPLEFNRELVQLQPKDPAAAKKRGGAARAGGDDTSFEDRDDLYADAVRIVLQHQRGSVSLLQRKLEIGYGRASRLIDFMAEAGIVGEYQGSQAREVTLSLDEWEAQRGEGVGALADAIGEDGDADELGEPQE